MTVNQVATPTEHPVYREFARFVEEIIVPAAVQVDATEVPRSHLDALREVGYFSWPVPAEYGGAGIPAAVRNAADDLLFGADPSTALALTQHTGPIGQILGSDSGPARELLPDLAAGKRIGGAGFAQIRSWPRKSATIATKVPGGYRFQGTVRWLSGWGLVDTAWLGGVDEHDSTYVFGIADLTRPGIAATALQLAAVAGSRTVSLVLDDYFVPDEYITEVTDIESWNAVDGTVHPNERRRPAAEDAPQVPAPGPVGLSRAALADALTAHPGEPALLQLSTELEHAAATPLPEPHWRAQLDAIALRATTAALVAAGGQGLLRADIAQVRARAALFLQLRGLSPRVRSARLEQYAH
ncbi:Acyl-CoA dehydrogenase, short-chain specific [Nocardia cerradoensis]|uniref:Acyl-CoA dehydrogenase, short-chain specific n=1 Tax=Nocardia cerradoensis TaxID=85688 RepID=A0A231HDU2_9NOCA|nr:acyl-CoA dehydrogenase family protein [Nocardia cerradoensis]OXR46915.1 Acyl-CoA dehydrogenase, short-chain specific [Nocardia cerradoensis]